LKFNNNFIIPFLGFKFLLVILINTACFSNGKQQGDKEASLTTKKYEWEILNSSMDRFYHSALVFDKRIWILGGISKDGRSNEIVYTYDGTVWVSTNSSEHWSPRDEHTSIVFQNKIWVMGGYDGDRSTNDVWYSSDGINWTNANVSDHWSPRYSHQTVVFENKIWVLGGYGNSNRNDIWNSADGINWTEVDVSDHWSPRSSHRAIVFNEKLWVMGAFQDKEIPKNDIWYSPDGANWSNAVISNHWPPRYDHTIEIFDNRMWVIGGSDHHSGQFMNNMLKNDVWYSTDGVSWTELEDSEHWSPRFAHASVVFDDKIWVIGGNDSKILKDIWVCIKK
jgi:leucine-zipper-like transcriptional regulator 1